MIADRRRPRTGPGRSQRMALTRESTMITSNGNPRQTQLILIGAPMLLSLGKGMRQNSGLFLMPVKGSSCSRRCISTFAVAVQNIAWDWSQVPIGAIAALSVSASQ
jgi:hypothetical protein